MKQQLTKVAIASLLLTSMAQADPLYYKIKFETAPNGATISLTGTDNPNDPKRTEIGRTGDWLQLQKTVFGIDGQTQRTFVFSKPGYRNRTLPVRWNQLQDNQVYTVDENGAPLSLTPESYLVVLQEHASALATVILLASGVAGLAFWRIRTKAAQVKLAQDLIAAENVKLEESNQLVEKQKQLIADNREDSWIGQTVGGYLIDKFIGEGAFGAVYRASKNHEDPVAIKIVKLPSDAERANDILPRISREFSSASKVNHPNVIRYHDWGKLDDQSFYFVMEFVSNAKTLQNFMDKRLSPPREFCALLLKVAQGMDAVHKVGVFHRDLKPENILIDSYGRPKVADFGTAMDPDRSRQTKGAMGTPSYMAPEQMENIVSQACDQYALGCIAYEYLSGAPPHHVKASDSSGLNFIRFLTARTQNPVDAIEDLPAEVNEVLLKILAVDPANRYPDVLTAIKTLHDVVLRA